MEYLTQEEVAMIYERWLARRVLKIKEPTTFTCSLCKEPGYGKYLHVCNNMAQPWNCRLIYEFKADTPDDRPDVEQIRHCVEREWHFFSEIKKSDYENELKEVQENTDQQ